MPLGPETALVTGASSGIGRELALVFAANKSNLILVARGKPTLDELAQEIRTRHGVQVDVFPKDLSEPGAASSLQSDLRAAGITSTCSSTTPASAFTARSPSWSWSAKPG